MIYLGNSPPVWSPRTLYRVHSSPPLGQMNPLISLISAFPTKILYASTLSLACYMRCATSVISFSHPETSRPVLRPTQASCSLRSGVPSREWSGRGVLVTTHMQLLLRLRMKGVDRENFNFIVILLWTKLHRIHCFSLYCNFIRRNRVKLPLRLIATPWVRSRGVQVNLVTSGDRLTSHPPSWTPDPIWNGGKTRILVLPTYRSQSSVRPALLAYLGLRHYVIALGYVTAYKRTVQVQFPAGIFGTLLFSDDTHGSPTV